MTPPDTDTKDQTKARRQTIQPIEGWFNLRDRQDQMVKRLRQHATIKQKLAANRPRPPPPRLQMPNRAHDGLLSHLLCKRIIDIVFAEKMN